MKKTAIRFGLYGIYALLAFLLLSWLLFRQSPENYKVQEIVGWAGIILSTSFVFFGLKYYRDKKNGGRLGFGEGLKLGVLITLFPALAFGIYNIIYTAWIDPDFIDKYYAYQVEQIRAAAPAAELDARLREADEQKQMFTSPLVQFIAMFFSVFFTGLIITVISTLVLKRAGNKTVKEPQRHRGTEVR